MHYQSRRNPKNFNIDLDDYIFDDSNSLELSIYNNSINNNNDLNTFFETSKNKLFEIEINEINNYNKNLEFLSNSINIKSNKEIKFISKKEGDTKNNKANQNKYIYRKDAYYKHFKSLFAKYIKDKANKLKNICFPYFDKNNFFSISSKYTGNPKEKDNLQFLSFSIKDLLVYGKDNNLKNRQYHNELLIKCIEEKESSSKDKIIYTELINFLYNTVENELINFYHENEIIKNDSRCLFFDAHYKIETNNSLIEKYGFLKILKKKY